MAEDDPDIRTVLELTLATSGRFRPTLVPSGREALELAPALEPDLILLDVMMPGLDGPATLKALRAEPATRDISVVFLTARAQPHELRSYREQGVVDVIIKPFDPLTLVDSILAIWSRCAPRS